MSEFLAHSAKGSIPAQPAQSYEDHVEGVCKRAVRWAREVDEYSKYRDGYQSGQTGPLEELVRLSAIYHDLGKLDDENQKAMGDGASRARRLPNNHVDAGSAYLLRMGLPVGSCLIYSHHRGLPNFVEEENRGKNRFRDDRPDFRLQVENTMPLLLQRHHASFPEQRVLSVPEYEGEESVFYRLALSCLADADHTDTAAAYGQVPGDEDAPLLRAAERLEKLDEYIRNFEVRSERDELRRQMYWACRNADVGDEGFSLCDSPVGSGKTTAIMAHALRQAIRRGARRIFVVLPFTTIIGQSVKTYREALVLEGEDPEKVVAELHFRADFEDEDTRYLTSLWRAPIVVTTAVSFFETLASNRPSALRRLHELPGSIVIVDEAHNALPVKLLPLAWRWMNVFAEEWGCYWIFASGSLVRFWDLSAFEDAKFNLPSPEVPELISGQLHTRLMKYEQGRISITRDSRWLSVSDLIEEVRKSPGPRLLIVNTVQTAAFIAKEFADRCGRQCVEHLSNALTSEDRDETISRVKSRLANAGDTDWTLVATSCVEAGVDFSFRSGFREAASVLSLLQASGRVNRHGSFAGATMRSFELQCDSRVARNPSLETARSVLKDYFDEGIEIGPGLSTDSMNNEIVQNDSCMDSISTLLDKDKNKQFKDVEDEFNVIESNTVPVVVDDDLAKELSSGGCDWHRLQKKAVAIRKEQRECWRLREIPGLRNVYQWTLGYDKFLGYMRGVLAIQKDKDTLNSFLAV